MKVFQFLIVIVAATSFSYGFNVLSIYDSYTFDETDSVMSSVYTGPLFATGGANSDINRYIKEMNPEKIGFIESNKITLIDSINEVYSFDSVNYYEVIKETDTFYVIKILAQMNNEKYDIVIELRNGPNYDRVLNIYKNGKPYTLILWIESSRLKQKNVKKT